MLLHDLYERYSHDAVKKVEKEREVCEGKDFEKNRASHDKDGIYKGDNNLAGNYVDRKNINENEKSSKKSLNKKLEKRHSVKGKNKPGKSHDHIHDDGTNLQWNKGKTFGDLKYSDFIQSNMFFNMTKSGDRAGDME